MLITVGLVAFGIVHLLVGWIALQLAWGLPTGGREASQQGALATMVGSPFGAVLLAVTAAGLAVLAVWQAAEAIWGHRRRRAAKRLRKRLGSAARAVIYAALALTALRTLTSGSQSGGSEEESMTGRVLAAPFGRILVLVAAAAVVAVGVRLIVKGVGRKFTEDLAGGVDRRALLLGQIGYVAKGVALAVVGGLLGWAAVDYDPERAGGLDDALSTVHDAPLGSVLLTLMALGFASFGVFCFFWARHPRTTVQE
ncbi:DUF1206 domain-containing protein [Nakamurella flavida]